MKGLTELKPPSPPHTLLPNLLVRIKKRENEKTKYKLKKKQKNQLKRRK